MLEPWVRKLVLETIDPWYVQEPSLTRSELVHALEVEQDEQDLLFVGSKKANLVFMVRYVTPWVASVNVFGKNDDVWALIRASKKACRFLFDKIGFHRLEAKTHSPTEIILARRCGWKLEGTHPESIKLQDGTFTEEYSYGVTNGLVKKSIQES